MRPPRFSQGKRQKEDSQVLFFAFYLLPFALFLKRHSPGGGQPYPRPGLCTGVCPWGDGVGLALAHLPQRGPHPLLGQTGLPFTLLSLPLDPLQRCQKPRCFWLAIDHGDYSFLRARPRPGVVARLSVGPPAPGWFVEKPLAPSPARRPLASQESQGRCS